MSLYLFTFSDNLAVVGADSRTSCTMDNETYYRMNDNAEKIHLVDGKIITIGGVEWAGMKAIELFKNSKDKSLEALRDIAKEISESTEQSLTNKYFLELCVLTYETNKYVSYNIATYNDYEIMRIEPQGTTNFFGGIHVEEAKKLFHEKFYDGIEIIGLYRHIYQSLVDEKMGGNLTIYACQNGKSIMKYEIPLVDKREIRTINYTGMGHFVASNNLLVSNTAGTVNIDGSGATFTDCSVTITNTASTSKVILDPNSTSAIKVQGKSSGIWNDVFSVDTSGNGVFSGIVKAKDFQNINGDSILTSDKERILADYIETEKLIVGDNIQMGANATISWGKVTDQPTIISSTDVTTITNNTISTTNVIAQNLKVNSANIQGTVTAGIIKTASSGARIEIGTDNKIKSYNAYGELHGIYADPVNFADLIMYSNGSQRFRINDNTMQVDLFANGEEFLAVSGGISQPYGNWDFSQANVSNLSATAKFA